MSHSCYLCFEMAHSAAVSGFSTCPLVLHWANPLKLLLLRNSCFPPNNVQLSSLWRYWSVYVFLEVMVFWLKIKITISASHVASSMYSKNRSMALLRLCLMLLEVWDPSITTHNGFSTQEGMMISVRDYPRTQWLILFHVAGIFRRQFFKVNHEYLGSDIHCCIRGWPF